MIKFKQHLREGTNPHLEHAEDMIFNSGKEGLIQTVEFLKTIGQSFSGSVNTPVNITVKWDGAPAIWAGHDPRDGKFFVAKKGIFNKDPVLYKTPADLADIPQADLRRKFEWALKEFPKLGVKKGDIIQGDLMFAKGDVKKENIKGEPYITFQPNTIVYAVPADSQIGGRIKKANIGVVWHTVYRGEDLASLKASFGHNISDHLKHPPTVWHDDATYKDVSGSITFTKKETELYNATIDQLERKIKRINYSALDYIAQDSYTKNHIKKFNHSIVKSGSPFPNPRKHSKDLFDYIFKTMKDEEAKLKSANGKKKKDAKLKEITGKLFHQNTMITIYEVFNHLLWAKNLLIKHLNKGANMKTFVRTTRGLRVTEHEGYVAVDRIGNVVKLVDRIEFTKANFSPNVIKGWQR